MIITNVKVTCQNSTSLKLKHFQHLLSHLLLLLLLLLVLALLREVVELVN